MQILAVNDDGIYAPGLKAMSEELRALGDVQVVAPLMEQSGVGHSITYLHPIMAKDVLDKGRHYGWAVDGSPADCVKMGVLEFCEERPELIVSGINSGANVGINVLYSGTVAAAIEGAFFGITSIAVSLSQGNQPDYVATAARAIRIIQEIRARYPEQGLLWNVNFPDTTPEGPQGIKWCSMGVHRVSERIEKRMDPRGRPYYWSGTDPDVRRELDRGTDVRELKDGYVTITPLRFDLTATEILGDRPGQEW